MNRFWNITWLSLLLCGPGLRGQDLLEDLRAPLERALTQPWAERYDELYDGWELQYGGVEALFDELLRRVGDGDAEQAARLRWIASFVAWRDGRSDRALRLCKQVLEHRSDALTRMRLARLLDIGGRPTAAEAAYREVLAVECDERTESLARLRLALLALHSGAEVESRLLAEFASAEGRNVELRNRAANVLALIGRAKEAGALYLVEGQGTQRFRDEVRLATWAIRAGDLAPAQQHAWRASEAAVLRRDRNYALSVLVEAYRLDDKLPALIARLAASEQLSDEARMLWIGLLRETGRVDAAVALFRSSRDEFTIDMQRELIEMYREAGRGGELVATYRELIEADPGRLTWREGLSRFYLENGDVAAAQQTWQSWLTDESLRGQLLAAATTAMELGLEEFSTSAAEVCIEGQQDRHQALLMLFDGHRQRGRLAEAEQVLARMDRLAPPGSSDRAALAEAYEQLGRLDRAVGVLEQLREARGEQRIAEDLEMRLAWLYSQVGREEQAMACWYELWRRVKSVARRRYVEDRLMTVAARLGKIAKVVVDLERKLADGTADQQDSGLLVRLYTKVNDPVSAAEVIDEFFEQSGGDDIEALQEKARVYLACTDYASYEEIVRSLIHIDPDGEVDYLRSLVMSQLERGRPDEARAELAQLRRIEQGFDSAEFEAGVLALAGLREQAVESYRRGIASHPNRIEIYLLLANLLKETGRTSQAVGMFQHIAETADKDDLFTIAIDGLLNMEAEASVLQWARRITLERMAGRHDKMYLYQLLADLSDELQDRDGMFDALEGSLAIAGGRRPSILRELMDLARGPAQRRLGPNSASADSSRQLAYGRRLIALGEVVPPQVYLDLGQAFLVADEITNAVKTFDLARDLADYGAFRRQVAGLYEDAGYLTQALRTYKQVLLGSPSDVGLLVKIAGLEEQVGRDPAAFELYRRATDLMVDRQPVLTSKNMEREDPSERLSLLFRSRNIDDTDRYLDEAITGILVTGADEATLIAELRRQLGRLEVALQTLALSEAAGDATSVRQSPRVDKLAQLCRRMAFTLCRPDLVAAADIRILDRFAGDTELLQKLCKERLRWGMTAAARTLVEAADRPEAQKASLRFLFGGGDPPARAIPIAQVASMLLPAIVRADTETIGTLLQKADLAGAAAGDLPQFRTLLAAARLVGDRQSALKLSQAWLRAMFRADQRGYEISAVHEQCLLGLDKAAQRQLDEFMISRITGGVENMRQFVNVLPEMQRRYQEPLLTTEQITLLIDQSDPDFAFGLGRLLEMLPASDRAAALRGRWAGVAKTKRLLFLLTIAAQVKEPMGEELAQFLVDALPEALADHSEDFRFVTHWFGQMRENSANFDVSLRLADVVLAIRPEEFEPQLLRAVVLAELGDEAAAAASAKSALRGRIDAEEAFEWNQAVSEVARHFLPRHFEELLAVFDELDNPTARQLLRRLSFVEMGGAPSRLLAETRAAAAAFPENLQLGQRLVGACDAAGRRVEALAALRELSQRLPQNVNLKQQVANRLRSFDRPVEALEQYRQLDAKKGPGRKEPVASAAAAEKSARPDIRRVKELLESDQAAAARVELRRLWRWGNSRSRAVGLVAVSGLLVRSMRGRGMGIWPVDPDEVHSRRRADQARRGGMATFGDHEPEPVERKNSYEVLGAQEVGLDEMRRFLRSLTVASIDVQRPLVDGLLQAAVERTSQPAVLAELLARVHAGRANKVHFVQLLELLEQGQFPSETQAARAELLDELVRTVDPADSAQVLRLARVYGSRGGKEAAAMLYRWAALTDGSANGRLGTVDAHDLVKAAKEHLDAPQLVQLVEELLSWSKPDDRMRRYELDYYETMALELWQEVAEPAQAFEHCRSLCEAITDVSRALRRGSAKAAVPLLARAGELGLALRCLEIALCKLPTEGVDVEHVVFLRDYERPGRLSHQDMRSLFPADSQAWQQPLQWFERAGDSLLTWLGEDRVDMSTAVRAASLLACRIHALGGTEAALALLDRLQAFESVRAVDLLWVVDALYAVGLADRAARIERQLLQEGRLIVTRAVEVVQRTADQEGAEAALRIGSAAAEVTHNEALLVLLAELAETSGQHDKAARWLDLNARSEAARAALLKRDKQARR